MDPGLHCGYLRIWTLPMWQRDQRTLPSFEQIESQNNIRWKCLRLSVHRNRCQENLQWIETRPEEQHSQTQ